MRIGSSRRSRRRCRRRASDTGSRPPCATRLSSPARCGPWENSRGRQFPRTRGRHRRRAAPAPSCRRAMRCRPVQAPWEATTNHRRTASSPRDSQDRSCSRRSQSHTAAAPRPHRSAGRDCRSPRRGRARTGSPAETAAQRSNPHSFRAASPSARFGRPSRGGRDRPPRR